MKKILIANRGEIASRVIKTCRRMQIKTVVVYAQDDRDLLYVEQADEAVYIGHGELRDTYLNQSLLLEVANQYDCDGLYPGYGFLSENAEFSKLVTDRGVKFIGPPPEVIHLMGDKKDSKQKMQEIGVPLIPGYHGDEQDSEFLLKEAKKIGFPVLIKATAGGGGKGMRIVYAEAEFKESLGSAKREAVNAFGNDKVLIEKYVTNPRHIEVQLVSDGKGNHFHFFERECSIQRRYQKVVEESPACHISDQLRKNLCETAVKIATCIHYEGAGTIEYILDETGSFYFLEMNTRLQVEHPITEMVTGVDLVELQIRAACGEAFSFGQSDIDQSGHSIECRIYAEDPDNDFLPTSGRIQKVALSKVDIYRLDHSLRDGAMISLNYDPMLAKIIVHGKDRAEALEDMQEALDDVVFGGVKSNRRFLKRILANKKFQQGKYDTNFIQNESEALSPWAYSLKDKVKLIAGALAASNFHHMGFVTYQKKVKLNDEAIDLTITKKSQQSFLIKAYGKSYFFSIEDCEQDLYLLHDGHRDLVKMYSLNTQEHKQIILGSLNAEIFFTPKAYFSGESTYFSEGSLVSPMPGKVFKILVSLGQDVKEGDSLLIMEAMKMEHQIKANKDGRLTKIFFKEGEQVKGGVQLVEIE